MRLDEYEACDATDLRALIASREVSAQEVLEIAVEDLVESNAVLNFLSTETRHRLAQGVPDLLPTDTTGPLAGVPFLVKEGGGLTGYALLSASRMGADLKADSDGLFVSLARRAGLAMLGTSNVPEFCSAGTTEPMLHGAARNPWDISRSTGGSSGGSASAVASRAIPIAHGSDGGGSIRIPSHCCGAFGLMPGQARTPLAVGGYGFPIEFTRQHVITRSVRDSAAMLDVLTSAPTANGSGPTSYLHQMSGRPRPLRIAVSTANPSGRPIDADCAQAVTDVAKALAEQGHDVVEAAPQYDWLDFSEAFILHWYLSTVDAISMLERVTGRKAGADNVDPSNLVAYEVARKLTAAEIARDLARIYDAVGAYTGFFLDHDILLTPVCALPAWELGRETSCTFVDNTEQWLLENVGDIAPHLPIVNASGQPAMSVPTHMSRGGLPVGVHLVARHNDEATLLQLAHVLEATFAWADRRPPRRSAQ